MGFCFRYLGAVFLSCLLILPLGVSQIAAAPSRYLPFSAKLKSATSGEIVPDGTYTITFRVYDTDTGGTPLWTEIQNLRIGQGTVSAYLGAVTPLPASLTFEGDTYYLGVQVGDDPEMSPRKRIGSVPQALNADTVDGAHAGTGAGNVVLLNDSGNLVIQGGASFGEALSVAGNASLTTLAVSSAATFAQGMSIGGSLIPTVPGLTLGSSTNHFAAIYVDSITAGSTDISGTDSQAFTINTDQATDNTESASLRFYLGPAANTYAALQWNGPANRFDLLARQSTDTPADMRLARILNAAGEAFDLPATADTLVGRASTDTLSNKTLSAPQVTGGLSVLDGNVGIGTASPASRLHLLLANPSDIGAIIQASSGQTADLEQWRGAGGNVLLRVQSSGQLTGVNIQATGAFFGSGLVSNNGASYARINGLDGRTINLETNGVSRIFVNSSGNVGIGTTSPAAILSLGASTVAAGGIDFGGDTNLYRSAANYLKTDDSINIGSAIDLQTNGNILATQLLNRNAGTNAIIRMMDTGIFMSRSVADNNPSLIVGQLDPSSTGDILQLKNSSSTVFRVSKTGTLSFDDAANGSVQLLNNAGALYLQTLGTDKNVMIKSTGTGLIGFNYNNGSTGPLTYYGGGTSSLFTALSSGKVGIGTESPQTKLHIYSNGTAVDSLMFGQGLNTGEVAGKFIFDSNNGGTLTYYGARSGSAYGNFVIQPSGGNVGIGTSSPSQLLSVGGTSQFNVTSAGVATANLVQFGEGNNQINTLSAELAVQYRTGRSTNIYWGSSGANSALFVSGSSGNVGLGTTSPASKLTVNGGNIEVITNAQQNNTLSVYSDTSYYRPTMLFKRSRGTSGAGTTTLNGDFLGDFEFRGSYNNSGSFYAAAAFGAIQSGDFTDINTSPGSLFFSTNPGTGGNYVERMRITPNGNVGIGTASPSYRLTVKSPTSATYVFAVKNSSDTDIALFRESLSGHGSLYLNKNDGSTQTLINSLGDSYFVGGNVGIGTASPAGLLQVGSGTGQSGWALNVVPSGGTAAQTFFVQDATATTGATKVVIKAGAGQSSTTPLVVQDYSGSAMAYIGSNGDIVSTGSGNFWGANLGNRTDPNNSKVSVATNGTSITRNVGDGASILTVQNLHASAWGYLLDLKDSAGTTKAFFGSAGQLYVPVINNPSSYNNASIIPQSNGTLVTRNIADNNVALTAQQLNVSSTGDILQLKNSVSVVAKFDISGNFQTGTGTAPATYALSVVPSGGTAGQTAFFQDATPTTGKTRVVLRSGAGQGGDSLQEWQDSGGKTMIRIFGQPSSYSSMFFYSNGVGVGELTTYQGRFNFTSRAGSEMAINYDVAENASIWKNITAGNPTFSIYGFDSTDSVNKSGIHQVTSNGTYVIDTSANRSLSLVPTSGGSVGIGTVVPAGLLQVGSGAGQTGWALNVTPSGVTAGQTLFVQDGTTVTGATRAVIKAGAGQGGTYLTEWQDASGSSLVTVSGAGTIFTTGNIMAAQLLSKFGASAGTINLSTTPTVTRNIADAIPAMVVQQVHASSTGDILQLKNATTTVLTVQKSGNMGIGTTSPSYRLTVKSSASATYVLAVKNTSDTDIALFRESVSGHGSLYLNKSDGTAQTLINSLGDSYFIGGNVGVATTAPAGLLQVGSGTGQTGWALNVTPSDQTAGQTMFVQDSTATTGKTSVVIRAGAGDLAVSDKMFVVQNANGTADWLSVRANGLVIAGSALAAPQIYNVSDSTYSKVGLGNNGVAVTRNVGDANVALTVQQVNASSTGDILQLKNSSTTLFTVQQGGNVGIGTTVPNARLEVKGTDTGTTKTLRVVNSAAAEVFSVRNNGDVAVAGTLTAKAINNSYVSVYSQGIGDSGMTGMFDRTQTLNAALKGNVSASMTGAGSISLDRDSLNSWFDAYPGTFGNVTGVDATTSQMVVNIDMGQPVANNADGRWQPYVMYRLDPTNTNYSFFNDVSVEVSYDNTTWWTAPGWSTTDFNVDQKLTGLWVGPNGNPTGMTAPYTWRYARFTFSDFRYGSGIYKDLVWIAEMGIRHLQQKWTDLYLATAGGTMYGDLMIQGNSSARSIGTSDDSPLVVKTNGSERIRILSNGNVGIGTTTPSEKLEVAGKIKTTGGIVKRTVALTDAATIATNADSGDIFTVTLAGNRTMAAPSGTPADGQEVTYRIKQDATGSRTLAWDVAFRFSTDLPAPTLSTSANATDYVKFIYNADSGTWDCVQVTKGF